MAGSKDAERNHIEYVELDAVTLLAVLVKRGNLRPAQLQRLGCPKRSVMRSLRRLQDSGALSKSEGAYDIRPEVVWKVKKISHGVEELDGLADFLIQMVMNGEFTEGQARNVTARILERMRVLAEPGRNRPESAVTEVDTTMSR